MSESLPRFLKTRALRHYKYVIELIEAVDRDAADRYASTHWPDHRWGIGQNGSIRGIVYHLAAWKLMTMPMFNSGGSPLDREQFEVSAGPDPDDWSQVRAWYISIGHEWNHALQTLSEEEFDTTRDWEGHHLPISSFVVEMMEHDVQHSSQIEYLLQRIAAEESIT